MVAFFANKPSRFSVLHRRLKADLAPSVLTVNVIGPAAEGCRSAQARHSHPSLLQRPFTGINEGRLSPIELVAATHAANMHEGARLEALYSVKK
jgi:hypothetical protein